MDFLFLFLKLYPKIENYENILIIVLKEKKIMYPKCNLHTLFFTISGRKSHFLYSSYNGMS